MLATLFLLAVLAPQPEPDAHLQLDETPRVVAVTGKIQCPKVPLVSYRGDVVRYASPLRVNPEFRERLRRFEGVVKETAVEVYGRAPTEITHLGSFNCRRIRLWPEFLSEHGLGNAVDVSGFVFPPLPRRIKAPDDLPKQLTRGFRVRLDPDWQGQEGVAAVHARFLHLLAQKLVARLDIFRVMLGPAYPGHKNHFHLDCAPWRIVEI
jgi:hypothetical protein